MAPDLDAPALLNPVLRGFFPDPSLVRVGEWYYLATSSFEWFPTIPLHRSRDLRTWEYVGGVVTAAPRGDLEGLPSSGGIWAPALSHDGERFWVTYAIVRNVGAATFDLTVHIATAPTAQGPWTRPVAVASHGFDPSLFHENGRHWLLNLQNDTRPGGERFAGIVTRELRLDLGPDVSPEPNDSLEPDDDAAAPAITAFGPTHLLWQQPVLIEGPKVVVRDGWYYLVLAEGGTGFEHGVRVARSRSLTGPYEIDPEPFLTTRDDPDSPLQKCGHAELVGDDDGGWVTSFLASRPVQTPAGRRCVLGREAAIEAVTWIDGWPRLAAGGTRPRVVVPATDLPPPLAGPAPTPAPAGPAPAPAPAAPPLATTWPWSTLRAPVGPWCAVDAPGALTFTGRADVASRHEVSLLAQRVPEHHLEVAVTIEADPDTFTQSAGLTLLYQPDACHTLHLTWAEPDGQPQRGQQWAASSDGAQPPGRRVVVLIERTPSGRRTVATREVPPGPVRLSAVVDEREVRYAVDGEPLGEALDVTELSDDAGGLRFTGLLVGVSAHDPVDRAFRARFSDWRWLPRER